MCGRYSVALKEEAIEEYFNAKFKEDYKPRYNAAPSQDLPVILNDDTEIIDMVHWGLMPIWAKKLKRDGIINIRVETLLEKPTFKKDLEQRRCLILSDGFYEWSKVGSKKMPYRFTLKDERPFAFAGIWEINKLPDQSEIKTFAIITTQANDLVGKIHNRMPIILEHGTESQWLEDGNTDLLQPYEEKEMKMYPVSTILNNARTDTVELIKPINSA